MGIQVLGFTCTVFDCIMASLEDADVTQAILRSQLSRIEDEELRQTLEITGAAYAESACNFNLQTHTEIADNPVTPPVQASGDAAENVAKVEKAIRTGQTSRRTDRGEQTRLFVQQHGGQMESGFQQAVKDYGFPLLSTSNFMTAPADGNCQYHAVQEGLPPTHFLHQGDADQSTIAKITKLRGDVCEYFCRIPEDLRVVIYPLDPNETGEKMKAWAKQPVGTGLWTYCEFLHLTLFSEYAGVSCAVYDLHAKSWAFLNTTAASGWSVVLVKTQGHYGSIAIDSMEDRKKVHNAMKTALSRPGA